MTVSSNLISQISVVIIPVADQERSLAFFVDKLGFEKRTDMPFGDGDRWLEVAPAGASTTLAIVPPPAGSPTGTGTGITLRTTDVDALHAEMKELGVDVGDVSRMGDPVPPMFFFRDPDGNSFIAVEQS